MKVVLEIITGTLFYIEVANDATVGDLKREIREQEKLPHDRLILLLNHNEDGLILMIQEEDGDEASLVDCGIQDGSHLYLFFNPLDNDHSPNHLIFTLPEVFLQ